MSGNVHWKCIKKTETSDDSEVNMNAEFKVERVGALKESIKLEKLIEGNV